MIYLIYLFAVIGLNTYILCREPDGIEAIKKIAMQQELHTKKTWRQLIGIYSTYKFHTKSDVKSDSFFLSEDGKTNPKSELIATIDGYYSAIPKNENMHPQCRFPARYLWLKRHIDLDLHKNPTPNCTKYKKWIDPQTITSIQLMFVDGYLSNPASFHGHLLLRFNTTRANLLNQTTNYGAIISANDNPIVYVTKGVLGGYDATYTDQQFYKYNHNYSNIEQRDIWAYTLQLSPDQREFLAAHNWELLGKKFSYYFFRDNCAYRIGRLLELVVTGPIVPEHIPWTLPSHIILNTTRHSHNIDSITYMPSRETKFNHAYNNLTNHSKDMFNSIHENLNFQNDRYETLTTEEKTSLLDAFIDYNQLQFSKTNHHLPYFNTILLKRLRLPASNHSQQYAKFSIHEFQKPGLIQPSISYTKNKRFGGIRLRASNYDILSADFGRLPNNIMEMGDIKINATHNFVTLDYLTLIQVFALNTPKNRLEKNLFSWKIHIGIDDDPVSNQPVFFTYLGIGKSRIIQKITTYGLVAVQIQGGPHLISWQPTIGTIASITPKLKTHASLVYYLTNSMPKLSIDFRYLLSKNRDIQLKFNHIHHTEIEFSHGIYW
jgi:hypothetical protein